MEGYVITDSGKRRPIVSPLKGSPPKKVPFTGITPLKDVNYEPQEKQPFRVSIEGNIGAGKSTLIKFFENVEGVETYAVGLHLFLRSLIFCYELFFFRSPLIGGET